MRWLNLWLADVRELDRLNGGKSQAFDMAIDAAVILVLLVDILAVAALMTGAAR
jgi:hypothetical protein